MTTPPHIYDSGNGLWCAMGSLDNLKPKPTPPKKPQPTQGPPRRRPTLSTAPRR